MRLLRGLPVTELKKSHIQIWIDGRARWRSPATHRSVLAIVLAAFNRAEELFDVPNPLKGLKKPQLQPRCNHYRLRMNGGSGATEECFRNFLFQRSIPACGHFATWLRSRRTMLRVGERGMMWRVYSSKTKKTRKIPVQAAVAALVRRLMVTAPKGSGKPLFRNTQDTALEANDRRRSLLDDKEEASVGISIQ